MGSRPGARLRTAGLEIPLISFEVGKLLSLLVYPLTQGMLLNMAALLLLLVGRVRLARLALFVSIAWLYLCSTGWFSGLVMASLESAYPFRPVEETPAADSIVVLGGVVSGEADGGRPGNLSDAADRLLHAAALYQSGKAPLIILSGGAGDGDIPEAQLMVGALRIMGVPAGAMVQEARSRNTVQNATFTREIMRRRGLDSVLLVTSAYHMRRAEMVFSSQGLQVIPSATDYQVTLRHTPVPSWLPQVDDLRRTTMAFKEYVGYRVFTSGFSD